MAAPDTPYFPVKHGAAAFAPTLDQVRHHRFPSPLYSQGFLSRDMGPDRAEKEFLAVNHFSAFIQTDIVESQEDRHLYELVTERTAVRPYFDLEWDPTQLDEAETLYTAFLLIASVLAEHGAQGRGVSVFCASNAVKASYHLLFDTVQVFRNAKELGMFVSQSIMPRIPSTLRYHVGEGVTKCVKCVIDAAPYGSSQSFRLPYQSKWKSGEVRRFLPFPVANVERGAPYYRISKGQPHIAAWEIPEAHVATIGVYEPVTAWLLEEGLASHVALCATHKYVTPSAGPLKGVASLEYDKVSALCERLTPAFLQEYKAAMNLIFCLWGVEQSGRMADLIHATCRRANNYGHRWVQNLIRSWKYSAFSVGSLVTWATACSSKDAVSAVLKQHVVTYQDELFTCAMRPAAHVVMCERYVSAVSFDACDTVILQSHLGTGKTVAITGLIRRGGYERVLIISPRKSYTYSQMGAFASVDSGPVLESYMDHSGSLGHLPYLIVQAESLWRVRSASYDLVIMDESESILCQMHSVVTHAAHMIENHRVLERVVRDARHVVCADAFVSDRTFHFVRALRSRSLFLENTYQPYNRVATLLAPIHKDRRVANLGALCERIMGALSEGRKIVVLWTSKRRGEWFVENFLKRAGYAWRFYHSGSSKEDVAGLQDVSVTWRGVQCLMMTTSITVGLSYDPKELAVEFDEAFLYGTSASAIPRDIAQALLRVRVLKAQRLTYVLETRAAVSMDGGRGLRSVTATLTLKEEHLTRAHPLVAWADCPVWARYNHCYNINEERISRSEYRGVLERYLVLSGYTLVEEIHVPAEAMGELLKVEWEDVTMIQWDQVDDVSAESAEDVLERMRKGEATKEEIWCYKKAMFRSQFLYGTDEAVLKAGWSRFFVAGHEGRFWNVVKERRQTATALAWEEAEARYGIMATGGVRARETIGVLLEILGMKHSQEGMVLGPERLEALAGPLEAAEKGLREGLGRPPSERKGVWKVSNTIDLITGLLETWGCSVVESEVRRPRINGKPTRQYELKINPDSRLWENIVVRDVEYDDSMFVF